MNAVISRTFEPLDPSDYPADQQIAQLRIPPHSVEAESSVLGGLLLDNSAWDRVGDMVKDTDFLALFSKNKKDVEIAKLLTGLEDLWSTKSKANYEKAKSLAYQAAALVK